MFCGNIMFARELITLLGLVKSYIAKNRPVALLSKKMCNIRLLQVCVPGAGVFAGGEGGCGKTEYSGKADH